jgi:hypothetical protein
MWGWDEDHTLGQDPSSRNSIKYILYLRKRNMHGYRQPITINNNVFCHVTPHFFLYFGIKNQVPHEKGPII